MITTEDVAGVASELGAAIIKVPEVPVPVSHAAHVEDGAPGSISWVRGYVGESVWSGTAFVMGHDACVPDHVLARKDVLLVGSNNPRLLVARALTLCPPSEVALSVGEGSTIDPRAILDAEALNYVVDGGNETTFPVRGAIRIGENVTVGPLTTIIPGSCGFTTIGNRTHIGHQVNIGHDVRIGSHCTVVVGSLIAGWARIGDGVKIYQGAVVKNGVRIGSGSVIGMGSTVLRDVPEREVWAGNPAKFVRSV